MIEKNIFQSWYTKDLHPAIQKKIDKFKRLNPDYNYYLYDDNEIDDFVNTYFPGKIADCYNKLNIIVAKVDFWRYLVLYKYGGVYLDMDSEINKPLNTLIRENDKAIITNEGNPNLYVQWALIYSKGHPILKRTIKLICKNIENNSYPNSIHKMTGPTVYTKAIYRIHNVLFNQSLCNKYWNKDIDKTFTSNNISYRIYGIDYNEYFTFKHDLNHLLFVNNKKHWVQEEKEKSLLKKN